MENNYKEYLESFAWKAIKQVKLAEQPECECCGEPATTVHHLSYERRGSEKEADIVSICERCHHECHFVNGYQIKNDEETLRKRFEEVRDIYGGNSKFSIEGEDIFYNGEKMKKTGKYYFYEEKIYIYEYNYYDDGCYVCNDYNDDYYAYKEEEEFNNYIENDGTRNPAFDGYGAFDDYNNYYDNDDNDISDNKKEFIGTKIVYSKDDNDGTSVIFELNVDFYTFKIIDEGFIKDKDFVYHNHEKLSGVDSESFNKISNNYFKDKNFVYSYFYKKLESIEGSDPKSFEVIDDEYSKDCSFIYKEGKQIKGADPETFEKIDDRYYRDKNFVYKSHGEKINYLGASPRGIKVKGADFHL